MQEPLHWLNRPFAELIRLAWPITVSMLSYSTMTVVGTAFVSGIGASALAGVGLAGVMLYTVLCFPLGLLRGLKVLVSQAVGADQPGDVGAYRSAGLVLAFGLAVLTILGAEIVAPVLRWLAASPEAGEYAVTYLRLRVLGSPALLCFVALREVRYGEGDARTPMVASVVGNVLNIVLCYIFVVMAGWGVEGVAWATVVANFVEAGALIAIRHGDVLALPRPRLSHIAATWRVGMPVGGQFLLEIGSFTLLTVMISAMSEVEMAAHQIVIHLLHFAFLPANAVAEAGSVLAGQAVGANRDDLVMGVARRSMLLAGAYALLCTLACVFFAPAILSLFTSEVELTAVARDLMYIAALFLIADGANMVARGVLRGAGDVRFAAAIGIVCAWILTPPLTALLGYQLGLGVNGGWLGLTAEIMACTAILWWRLRRGGWKLAAARSRVEISAEQGNGMLAETAAVPS